MSSISDPGPSPFQRPSQKIRGGERSGKQTERRHTLVPPRQKRLGLITILSLLLVPLLAILVVNRIKQSPFIRLEPHVEKSSNVLIITAHPDDEVMFFAPTILALVEAGWSVRGLCLSTGDSSGLGDTRSRELEQSYAALGVDSPVQIIDHPDLQDGMDVIWDPALIADYIVNDITENGMIDMIITFDEIGITHHPNHIALPLALSYIYENHLVDRLNSPLAGDTYPFPEIYYLTSPPLSTKFTGPLYAIYLHLLHLLETYVPLSLSKSTSRQPPALSKVGIERRNHLQLPLSDDINVISSPREYMIAIRAMREHHSQLVWFRWLYLAFSRLMWVNELFDAHLTLPNLTSP